MAHYPIVNKRGGRAQATVRRGLPTFYMEGHAVIGLQVDDCQAAVRILDRNAFRLGRENGLMRVGIDSPAALRDVVTLLAENGLQCEIADVVDGIYQG